MEQAEPIEDILNLANDALPSECPIFQTQLDLENYDNMLSSFGTPPNRYANNPLPCVPDESSGKGDINDPLVLPDGSPVTPQIQESSTILSEIDFEVQEYPSPFESKPLFEQRTHENHCEGRSFASTKIQTRTNEQHTGEIRHSLDTDFQELLELGKAMNFPSGMELGTSTLYPGECGGTQETRNESSDNIDLLPFPLDDIFTPLANGTMTDDQNCAIPNTFSLTPSVTQTCPDSSPILSTEIGTSHQSLVSTPQCNPKPANIDEVLLEVASRNSRRCKRNLTSTQSDEASSEVGFKKRKTTSSTGEMDGEGYNSCKTNRSAGQRKKSSKKAQGYCRKVPDKPSELHASPGSTPSRFCHICTRAAKPDVVLVCGNVAKGTCRKVICFKCIRDMSWEWSYLQGNDTWTCTHCREGCPAKAQCHTYRRVNQNRRADGRRSRKATIIAPAESGENNDPRSS